MGKTKIKVIDDSAKEEKKEKPEKKVKTETLDTGNLKLDIEAGSLKLENQASNIQPQIPTSSLQRTASKSTKPGKSKPRSKKYQKVSKDLDRSKSYPIDQAVDMVKKLSYAKFNATIEAHINTVQTGIHGLVSLPFASGKKLRILVFPPAKQFGPELTAEGLTSQQQKELENEGVVFGTDITLEDINAGKINFDLVITTPEWMSKLAKVAKILGPKGFMPNPKNGTITDSSAEGLKKAVESFQAGKTEYEHSSKQVYKTEPKAPIIHMALGKLNQPNEELIANITTLLSTLGKTKIKKVSLSPTMGPSVKLDLASI